MVDGKLPVTGKVGAEVTPEEAKELAAHLRAERPGRREVGRRRPGPDRARGEGRRLRRLGPRLHRASRASLNGASELLGEVLGDKGVHARSAVGVAVLPLDAPVEVEIQVELAD